MKAPQIDGLHVWSSAHDPYEDADMHKDEI